MNQRVVEERIAWLSAKRELSAAERAELEMLKASLRRPAHTAAQTRGTQ